ncbi:hypothetical protein ACSQ67_016187 [Phaseolus vulgaris]
MICRGPVLGRARGRRSEVRVEELSRLEHEPQEAGHNLKRAVEADTTYEKRLCAQAAEPGAASESAGRAGRGRCGESCGGCSSPQGVGSGRPSGHLDGGGGCGRARGKKAVEAEVLKTMEDTMVPINQSFDLAVRRAAVLYGGPPPSGQFDQDMEVVDGRLFKIENTFTDLLRFQSPHRNRSATVALMYFSEHEPKRNCSVLLDLEFPQNNFRIEEGNN